MSVDAGERFVAALTAKDTAALLEVFAPTLEFRAMTPRKFWEATTPDEVVHDVLYQWFDTSDLIESIDNLEVGTMVDRGRVDYRVRVRNGDGLFAVEQRAYFDVDSDDRIARMHVMCSGYRPLEA